MKETNAPVNSNVLDALSQEHENTENKLRFSYSHFKSQVKFLQGKILTVIDASIVEPRQNKAVKDLVNKAVSEQLKWMYSLASDFSATLAYIPSDETPPFASEDGTPLMQPELC